MNPLIGDGYTPCSPEEAVQRMLELEASRKGQYVWGTGAYQPKHPELMGMTTNSGLMGWDCAGAAISYAYRLMRHRPGFNVQGHATVSDDINCDSVLEDADPARGGMQELGEIVEIPAPGVLLITPTIRIPAKNFVEPGHVRLIIDATHWHPDVPLYENVIYLECHGPNGHTPGVTRSNGRSVDLHDQLWPRPLHRAAMVRIRARP